MKRNVFYGLLAMVLAIGMAACSNGSTSGNGGGGDDNKGGNKTAEWVDPATQTTQLTGGTQLLSYSGFDIQLPGSPYFYNTWDYSNGVGSTNKFTWYGANQGGGGAFRAEWTSYLLSRLGFGWWENGKPYTNYGNIYIDYNFRRSSNAATDWGMIGMYGWSRNPSATEENKKLIEYYIVDDWFDDAQLGLSSMNQDSGMVGSATQHGSFTVDGATYIVYSKVRNDETIDGVKKPFTQLLSVRQGRRTYGTISVTEHFKEWSKYIALGNLQEVKFKVEAGGNGYLDLSYLYLSQEDTARTPVATPPTPGSGDGGEETAVGSYAANASNPHTSLSSPNAYTIVNLPSEGKTNVMKVANPSQWAAALYDLSAYKGQNKTITFSANVKRVGAAGTLNWQINNSDYPSVGSPINNAAAGTWHSMSGTWTGTLTGESPSFYLSTYENNSGSTTYYIADFTVSVN